MSVEQTGKCFYVKEKATGSLINKPSLVYEEMKDIANADQESFWVLSVNTKNKIISKDLIGLGGISSAMVDMKILFRRILLNNAESFIVVHNHPSGEVEPSKQDIELTDNIKKFSKIIDLTLLDHLIIGEDKFFSFTKEGLCND